MSQYVAVLESHGIGIKALRTPAERQKDFRRRQRMDEIERRLLLSLNRLEKLDEQSKELRDGIKNLLDQRCKG